MSLLYLDSWGVITDAVTDPLEIHRGQTGSGRAVTAGARYVGSPNAGYQAGINGTWVGWRLPASVTYPLWFGYALRPVMGYQAYNLAGMCLGAVAGSNPSTTSNGGVNSLIPAMTPHRGIVIMERTGSINGVLLSVSDPCIPGDGWCWVEGCIELVPVHEGATRTIIKIDNNIVADQSGLAWQVDIVGNDIPFSQFVLGATTINEVAELNSNNVFPITDFYLCDSAGPAPYNTWLGELQLECKLPTGDSATYVQWTPTGGGAHYTQVDDTTPDDDTTYVQAATDKKDAYTRAALTNASGTVLAVQASSAGRLLDPHTDYYQDIIVRRAGADGLVAATIVPQSRFLPRNLYSRALMTQDPTDSSTWTIAKVNACEFGPRRPA